MIRTGPERATAAHIAFAAVVALLAGSSPGQDPAAPAPFVSDRFGLQVRLPGPEWQFAPLANDAEGAASLRLDLLRRVDDGVVGARATVTADDGGGVAGMLADVEAIAAAGDPYEGLRRVRGQVADRAAPGIVVDYRDPKLGAYRVRQHFVVANGLRYLLQCHAPVARFAEFEPEFDRFLAGVRLSPVAADIAADARLRALVARCGSEVDWAESWEDAAARARAANVPVLVTVRRYRGFVIANQLLIGPFMDLDVLALVRERFVPLQLNDSMPAPFRAQQRYGMSATTFGSALLVVSADGEVLDETHAAETTACYEFLVGALARLPDLAGLPEPAALDPVERAARALRRGELARVAQLCPAPSTAREHLLLASMHRLRRDGPAALAALDAARAADPAPDERRLAALAEVGVRVRIGQVDAARVAIEFFMRSNDGAADDPEAMLLGGICALLGGQSDLGRARLQRLVAGHPDARWAWQAAAVLQSPVLDRLGEVRVQWPAEDVLAAFRNVERATDAPPLADVTRGALRSLLDSQRPDGSWISPSEIGGARADTNPFVVAITALGGRCLLPRRHAAGAGPALERALAFVLAAHARSQSDPAPVYYMDYTVWSESIALWFLADCIDAAVGDAVALRAVMSEKVAILSAKVRPSGGFSYYVTADLAAAGAVPEHAMSFTTAAVVVGLCRAREVGVPVAGRLLDGALDCLQRARNDNGAFDYMVGVQAGDGETAQPGAAGRGPLCEFALWRGGRGDLDALRGALAIFRDHRAGLHKELGKALMHAGPDGQGCHYLFFDYATAATAVAALPAAERSAHAEWLLELVLPARSVEGGFRDTSINGWAFGTAMALTVLSELGVQ